MLLCRAAVMEKRVLRMSVGDYIKGARLGNLTL